MLPRPAPAAPTARSRRRDAPAARCRRLPASATVRRVFRRRPVAATAPVVRHGQVGEQRGAGEFVEHRVGPGDVRLLHAADDVVAARQARRAERAEHAADEQAATESQATGGQIGLQARQRTGESTAEQRGLALAEPLAHRVVLGQPAQDLVACMPAEPMQGDQSVGAGTDVRVQPLRQRGHRHLLRRGVAAAGQAEGRAQFTQPAAQARLADRLPIDAGLRQPLREHLHRLREGLLPPRPPFCGQARK